MSKQKLLVIGEAGNQSGFEKIVRGIATHLHERGDYDVVVRGLGYDPQRPMRRYPYTVKTTDSATDDIFGTQHFKQWLAEDKPDALFVVHDLWNVLTYVARKPLGLPTVAYFPVDAPCLKASYCLAFGAVSEAVAYTRFGAYEAAAGVRGAVNELRHVLEPMYGTDTGLTGFRAPQGQTELHGRWDRLLRYQEPQNFNIIPHGRELGVFAPRDKGRARSMLGIPEDAFVVLNVGTNSPRKRFDLTIKAFRHVAAARKDAYLVLHCSNETIPFSGIDLTAAAQYYGVPRDRIVLSHLMYPWASDDEMCWIYNAASVQINTSGGEGYSLTALDGAECGVPQVVPDWSATRELWSGYGELIPIKNTRMENKFLNTVHCEVNTAWLGSRLVELSESPDTLKELGSLAAQFASSQHTWSEVGEAFHAVIQNALHEPDARPVTFTELEEARATLLVSEGIQD